jgi:hypothetical protein
MDQRMAKVLEQETKLHDCLGTILNMMVFERLEKRDCLLFKSSQMFKGV